MQGKMKQLTQWIYVGFVNAGSRELTERSQRETIERFGDGKK